MASPRINAKELQEKIGKQVAVELGRTFDSMIGDLRDLRACTIRNEERVQSWQASKSQQRQIVTSTEEMEERVAWLSEQLLSQEMQTQQLQQQCAAKAEELVRVNMMYAEESEALVRVLEESEILRAEKENLRCPSKQFQEELNQHRQAASTSTQLQEKIAAESSRDQQQFAKQTQDLVRAHEESVATLREDNAELQLACQDARNQAATASGQAEEHFSELSEQLALQEVQTATLQQQFADQFEELVQAHEDTAKLRFESEKQASQLDSLRAAAEAEKSSLSSKVLEIAVGNDLHNVHIRNSELLLTLEQFKQDCETLQAENQGLRESVAAFEDNLDKVAGQNAKMMGHTNHKQKIMYTMKLQESNTKLREEVNKMRKKYLALEASKRGTLFEALPSLSALLPACCPSQSRSTLSGVAAAPPRPQGLSQAHEIVLEAVIQDFLHLRALLERAVSEVEIADQGQTQSNDMSMLLKRLR